MHMITKHNPQISELFERNFYSSNDITERINLDAIGFNLAFSVEGTFDEVRKDDPHYVRYLVRASGKENGKGFAKLLSHHICTEEDWAKFPPPVSARDETKIKPFQEDPER